MTETLSLARASQKELDAAIWKARLARIENDFHYFCEFVQTEEGPLPFWAFQEDIIDLVNQNKSFIWLKRRQIMASWLMAAATLWVSGFHRYAHSALFSKDQDESNELIRRIRVINYNLPSQLRRTLRGTEPVRVIETHAEITPFAATRAGGVGRQTKFIFMDEFALHPFGAENRQAIQPAFANSGGMLAIASTSNPDLAQSGAMYREWQRAKEGKTRLVPVFSNAYCRPDQGDAFLAQERKEYEDDHIYRAHYPVIEDDAFTSRTGLVFGREGDILIFDPELNTLSGDDIPPWQDAVVRGVGIDQGGDGGDPSAIVPVGLHRVNSLLHPFTDRYHAYWGTEDDGKTPRWYKQGAFTVDEIRDRLDELNAYGRIHIIAVDSAAAGLTETLVSYGYPAVKADKDRSGILYVRDLFRSRRLTIDRDDHIALDHINTYEWAKHTGDYNYSSRGRFLTRTPSRHHGEFCLAAGTLIETLRGPRRIDEVCAGEMVLTRDGYAPVAWAGMTNASAAVYEVVLSNGRTIIGTGQHPVWVKGNGFLPIDALRYGDIMETCKDEQFISRVPDWQRRHGIDLRKGGHGTPLTEGNRTQTESRWSTPARDAVASTRQSTLGEHGFVPTPARLHGVAKPASTTSRAYVRYAEQPSFATDTARRGHAPVHVVQSRSLSLSVPVYNLSIDGPPEFYANGILVHNCDAVRYILTAIRQHYPTIDQRQAKRHTGYARYADYVARSKRIRRWSQTA